MPVIELDPDAAALAVIVHLPLKQPDFLPTMTDQNPGSQPKRSGVLLFGFQILKLPKKWGST